jgi:crotonobetainyl-CoA:carnitine CoA-transferase CaiB-like acyl-CoA transferase
MSGPMKGVRVLDLTSVIMGPYATQILGDYGADVVKIEPPEGDVMRKSGPARHDGMGHFFLTTNRSKRSAVIDLKQPAGRAALLKLAETADVLVYNIRPQAMARLGLSYEELRAVNPRIIYAGAYGFSQQGPYAARPAYDDLIQGMSGIPWLGLQAGQAQPRYAPMVLVDRMAGLQLVTAIGCALYHRASTGEGQRVDAPMFEGIVSMVMGEHLAGHLYRPPIAPMGYQRSIAADRRPLQTRDGYICVMVYSDKQWRAFFDLIGRPEVFRDDARFNSHGARLVNIEHVYGLLSETIRTRDTQSWLDALGAADIPCARMNSLQDIAQDEHLAATGFFQEIEHPTEGRIVDMAVPTEWSASPPGARRHAPALGEHTSEVLKEAGYSDADVDGLLSSGCAVQSPTCSVPHEQRSP